MVHNRSAPSRLLTDKYSLLRDITEADETPEVGCSRGTGTAPRGNEITRSPPPPGTCFKKPIAGDALKDERGF